MIGYKELIAKFQQAYTERWGYIWGSAGSVWNESDQTYANKMYAKSVAESDGKGIERWEMTAKYGSKWIGRKVADCSGLFAWAFKALGSQIAHGQNSIWKNHTVSKGELKNSKRTDGKTLRAGSAVFRVKNNTDYYHIGLYVGDGKVIEAQGTQAGVVISQISRWHAWAELKNVNYEEEAIPVDELKDAVVTADGGVNFRSKPAIMANKITTIPKGAVIKALEYNSVWSRAVYDGKEGYVMTQYITYGEAPLDDNADALKLVENIEKELAALKRMLQA